MADYPLELTRDRVRMMDDDDKPKEAWVTWIGVMLRNEMDASKKRRSTFIGELIRKFGADATIEDVMLRENGHAFRRLESYRDIKAWTDDHPEITILWMDPTVQRIRRSLGFPTPLALTKR